MLNSLWYKIIFNKYNNNNNFNNNDLIEKPKSGNKVLWPFIFNKYFNFLNTISKMPFKLKKENNIYTYMFIDALNVNVLNFCIFYWFLLIPYFFFEYVLIKYHLKGHVLIKRRVLFVIKVLLHSFNWYIKLFKFIGHGFSVIFKYKTMKIYEGIRLHRNKKKLKYGYFFKWDRYQRQMIRVSPLGSYYYWFFKINRKEYFFSYYKYFFNFSFKSNYFCYIYFYIIIMLFLIEKKYKQNNLKFNFLHNIFKYLKK